MRRYKRSRLIGRLVHVDHDKRVGTIRLADGSSTEWACYFSRSITGDRLRQAEAWPILVATATWHHERVEFTISDVKPIDSVGLAR